MARVIAVEGDVAYVPLTQGKVAVIDADLAEVVGRWSWHAEPKEHLCYAARKSGKGPGGKVFMHREIMGARPGEMIDHRDGDGHPKAPAPQPMAHEASPSVTWPGTDHAPSSRQPRSEVFSVRRFRSDFKEAVLCSKHT